MRILSASCTRTLSPTHTVFIFEVVKAYAMPKPKYPETLHYTGDGVFTLSGKAINLRKLFTKGV